MSSIKHHKLKRKVELMERKILRFSRTLLDNSINSPVDTPIELMHGPRNIVFQ